MALRPTQIRIDPELHAITQAEAKRLGMSWSEYVRQALVIRFTLSAAIRIREAGGDPEAVLASVRDVEGLIAAMHACAAALREGTDYPAPRE